MKRFPDATSTPVTVLNNGDRRQEWKDSRGRGVMEMRGSRVAIIEGVPANANLNKLLNTIWQQPRPQTTKSSRKS